jgi:hypothetical protein
MSAVQRLTATVASIEHNLNLVPAHVQCDECGDQYKAGHKYMPSAERASLAEALREAGWLVEGDHERHVCPQCRVGKR